MKNLKFNLLLLILVLLTACSKNAFKQFESGDTEAAYKTLYKKAKKKKIERKELSLFREILSENILEDSISFFKLRSYDRLESDIEAYKLFDDLLEADEEIAELRYKLPRYGFLSPNLHDEISDDITETLFQEAEALLISAEETANKEDARLAYDLYDDMEDYHTHDRYPIRERQETAEYLGKEYILVSYEVNTFSYNGDVERNMDITFFNSTWKEYHEDIELNVEYDAIAEVSVDYVDFDDDVRSSSRNYSERIVTGYETEKDTSGVLVQVPVYENVSATVFTDLIERTLYIRGEVDVRIRNGRSYDDNIREQYSEQSQYLRYEGDIRAIPSNIQSNLEQPPNFSSESRFYQEAMEEFMDEAQDIIENIRI